MSTSKVLLFILIVFGMIFSACSPVATTTPAPTPNNVITTPSLFPTNTSTPTPTVTLTSSITPLPTIPTFTPTFDVSTIVTVTSAPKAECPIEDPTLVPEFALPDHAKCNATGNFDYCFLTDTPQSILRFLNQGGSVKSVIDRLNKASAKYAYQDVTGDSIDDFMFVDFRVFSGFNVYVCKAGQYELIQPINDSIRFHSINDINRNGIPEIILSGGHCSGSGCIGFYVLEWNDNNFIDLGKEIGILGPKETSIEDVDGNSIKEFVLIGDRPGSCCEVDMMPWRFMTEIYSWNGEKYSESYRTFTPPEYRFQAIQDADRESKYGHYDLAMSLYQDVIFNKQLEWWSQERRDFFINEFFRKRYLGSIETPTSISIPTLDVTEYPRLATYAYYRIMLLYIVQEYKSDAGMAYNTLQQKFGNDPYGRPYVEMATEFWNAYQSSHEMYDGCASAIQYAVEHPEILVPLGSNYHGWQSHNYKPEDVCPFR